MKAYFGVKSAIAAGLLVLLIVLQFVYNPLGIGEQEPSAPQLPAPQPSAIVTATPQP